MNESSKPLAQITVNLWLSNASATLSDHQIPTPRLDAEVLLAHVLKTDRTWLIAHGADTLESDEKEAADQLLEQRTKRIPIAYLTGVKEFYGRDFIVTSDVLIPRPETETLIDLLKKYIQGGDAIDVGCGSGCIGITAALEIHGLTVTLSDISQAALDVTKQNSDNLRAHVSFVQSDLLRNPSLARSKYDVIIANLPYVDTRWERSPETDHEPSLALFADNNGLQLIYNLIDQASSHLKTNGYVLLEADPEQHPEIIDYGRKNGFQEIESRDYALLLRLV